MVPNLYMLTNKHYTFHPSWHVEKPHVLFFLSNPLDLYWYLQKSVENQCGFSGVCFDQLCASHHCERAKYEIYEEDSSPNSHGDHYSK